MPFFCLVTKVPSIDARELWMEDLEAEKSDWSCSNFLAFVVFFPQPQKLSISHFCYHFFFHTSGLSPRNLELRCR